MGRHGIEKIEHYSIIQTKWKCPIEQKSQLEMTQKWEQFYE